jgi:ribonuclease Z
VSALALTFVQEGKWWLFDCGEGTQHQIQRTPLKLSRLERIFITHLHGDHIFGLPGLLASRSLQDNAESPLEIVGPPGTEEFVRTALRVSGTHVAYPLSFKTLTAPSTVSTAIVDEGVRVEYAALRHGILCYGYAVIEDDKAGTLDVDKLAALGIRPGPIYGRIKAGETVTLDDGRVVDGRDFVGPDIRGRKVVICGDTSPTDAVAALGKGADVLVHEATFVDADVDLARRANHSTASQAAAAAVKAGVKSLILTHISPRYDDPERSMLPVLLAEAVAVFPESMLASDLWSYDVERR